MPSESTTHTHTAESQPVQRSVDHGIFTLTRTYDAPAARVFAALSELEAKSKWFAGPSDKWKPVERSMDFRVGGHERAVGQWEGGDLTIFDATYHDIVPGERIVYSYVMWHGERKLSVSLATLVLTPETPRRTTLTVTEQGAFLDGDDDGSREAGTNFLLDQLGKSLAE